MLTRAQQYIELHRGGILADYTDAATRGWEHHDNVEEIAQSVAYLATGRSPDAGSVLYAQICDLVEQIVR